MPYWMSRIAAQAKLFHTSHTAGMSYSTAVASTCGVMVKPPSPQIDRQGRSGAASLAPRMPLTPKPIAEKPQVLSIDCGRRASQNCMNQLWCTPLSSEMMASSGRALRTSFTTRSGRSGEPLMSKFGAVKACHSRFQPSIICCHAAKRLPLAPRLAASCASWPRNTLASAMMPSATG